jgi:hypothetical protein
LAVVAIVFQSKNNSFDDNVCNVNEKKNSANNSMSLNKKNLAVHNEKNNNSDDKDDFEYDNSIKNKSSKQQEEEVKKEKKNLKEINMKNLYITNGETHELVLEVADEAVLAKFVYDNVKKNFSTTTLDLMLHDVKWNLLFFFQTSLLGQMLAYFEQLSALNSCNAFLPNGKTFSNTSNNFYNLNNSNVSGVAWENILRKNCAKTFIWCNDDLPARQKIVPFAIRASELQKKVLLTSFLNGEHEIEEKKVLLNSRLFQLLDLFEKKMNFISDWTLFSFFIEDACLQVRFFIYFILI